MNFINLDEVGRAADALTQAYGAKEALAKARLIEVSSVVREFAQAVREELESRCAQRRLEETKLGI
jgi:hypothetical protein